jgi:hypothetical protein
MGQREISHVVPYCLISTKSGMDVMFGAGQLVRMLRDRLGSSLGASTVYRWLNEFGHFHPPYDLTHVDALAHYGVQRRGKVEARVAKQRTIEYLRSKS